MLTQIMCIVCVDCHDDAGNCWYLAQFWSCVALIFFFSWEPPFRSVQIFCTFDSFLLEPALCAISHLISRFLFALNMSQSQYWPFYRSIHRIWFDGVVVRVTVLFFAIITQKSRLP